MEDTRTFDIVSKVVTISSIVFFFIAFTLVILLGKFLQNTDESAVTFAVIGNWGQNGRNQQKDVASAMSQWCDQNKCQFIVSTGDNFENGVSSKEDTLWKSNFQSIYNQGSLSTLKWYCVLGDRDYLKDPNYEIQYSNTDVKWNMPDFYYKKSIVSEKKQSILDLFFIDTSPFMLEYYSAESNLTKEVLRKQNVTTQLTWLKDELSKSNATWKIVVGHHPIFSGTAGTGNNQQLVEKLKPVLASSKAQIYFSGHEFNLQALLDVNIAHFISGAGAESKPVGVHHLLLNSYESSGGFLGVQLNDGDITVQGISTSGKTFKEYRLIEKLNK